MTPAEAAGRLLIALAPRHRVFELDRRFQKFAREVAAEAGPGVAAAIVRQVEQHAALGRAA